MAEPPQQNEEATGSSPPPLMRHRKTSKLAIQDATKRYNADDVSDIVLAQSLWRRRLKRKQFKGIVKRTYIIQELYSTEKAYVDSLRYVVEKYEKPLFERVAKNSPIVPDKDLKTIFFQIQAILANNITLLEQLEKRLKQWNINQVVGDIFVKLSPSFESYTAFVNNYELASATLRKHLRTNEVFAKFTAELEQSSAQRLKLADYLIMPVQRIPRYELLLSQILAQTSASHPDFNSLKAAVLEIKRVADFINEKKRQAEARAKVAEIESKLFGDFPPLVVESRTFVREGDIVATVENARDMRRLVLFNDALLCINKVNNPLNAKAVNSAKEFEFDWMVPLLNLDSLNPVERPVKEQGYIEPDEIMKEIVKLEKQLEIERHIEKSAAKIAQIYKAEHNRATKNEAKREIGSTESNMELIAKDLKYQRELMRLFEPVVGLQIVTDDNHAFTFAVRSTTQRDEWMRDINAWRKKELARIGEDEASLAAKKKKAASSSWSFKAMWDASVSSISSITSISRSINKKVIDGVGTVSQMSGLVRSSTVISERRRLVGVRNGTIRQSMSRAPSSNSLVPDPSKASASTSTAKGPIGVSAAPTTTTAAAVTGTSSTTAAPAKLDVTPVSAPESKPEEKHEPPKVAEKVQETIVPSQTATVATPSQQEPQQERSAVAPIAAADKPTIVTSLPYTPMKTPSTPTSVKQTLTPFSKDEGDDKASPGLARNKTMGSKLRRGSLGNILDRAGSLMGITVLPSSPIVEINPLRVALPESPMDDEPEFTHTFETKEFARSVRCNVCLMNIAPFGREGLKCAECSFRCHRKCVKQVAEICTRTRDPLMDKLDDTAEVSEDFLLTPRVFDSESTE